MYDFSLDAAPLEKLRGIPRAEQRQAGRDAGTGLFFREQSEQLAQVLAERGGVLSVQHGDAVEGPFSPAQARADEDGEERARHTEALRDPALHGAGEAHAD